MLAETRFRRARRQRNGRLYRTSVQQKARVTHNIGRRKRARTESATTARGRWRHRAVRPVATPILRDRTANFRTDRGDASFGANECARACLTGYSRHKERSKRGGGAAKRRNGGRPWSRAAGTRRRLSLSLTLERTTNGKDWHAETHFLAKKQYTIRCERHIATICRYSRS